MVRHGGQDGGAVEIVEADLSKDDGWRRATDGCRYVLHLASPFPSSPPPDEEMLISPARDGALRVLSAAHDAGVDRVVLTSSFAAIGYGHHPGTRAFTETDWTDVDQPDVRAYTKSKTLAERAAWDFVDQHDGLELAVINPVVILGPLLGQGIPSSLEIVKRLMTGALPGVPRLAFGIVDVRDVAELHLRAMTDPRAAGQRYLAVSGDFMTLGQVAGTLRARLGPQARKVPTRKVPDSVMRLGALFSPAIRDFVPELGRLRHATSTKAIEQLGWSPRRPETTIVDTARSLIAFGLA